MFRQLLETNVTKPVHNDVYRAIDPLRPELSQRGRVVLIPGGGTGVGFSIAESFVRASANTIIIIARRYDVLNAAAAKLEQLAMTSGTGTKIITRTCDITKPDEVNAFWEHLQEEGITVDVFVSNVAKFTEPKPLLELGADEVWSQFEVNVKSAMHFTDRSVAQSTDRKKVSFCQLLLPR
jgi:NAD(P)-dependent dehydrogenase (short-subunit alcohol dehydrogenase family)